MLQAHIHLQYFYAVYVNNFNVILLIYYVLKFKQLKVKQSRVILIKTVDTKKITEPMEHFPWGRGLILCTV